MATSVFNILEAAGLSNLLLSSSDGGSNKAEGPFSSQPCDPSELGEMDSNGRGEESDNEESPNLTVEQKLNRLEKRQSENRDEWERAIKEGNSQEASE
jgi:hypothetical protein